jgi:hypothetical protein
MSIASMVDTHLAAQIGADTATASPPSPQGVPTNILNQITRWIPTETIAVYVAMLPLLAAVSTSSPSYTSRWILFGLVAAANPVIVVLIALAKIDMTTFSWKAIPFPLFAIIMSTVAFAAWAFALPDTPLSNIGGYNTKWGIAIITTVTIGITLIANAFHKSPDFDQVQTQAQGAVPGPG